MGNLFNFLNRQINICQTLLSSLTSRLAVKPQVESQWSCMLIRLQKLLRTSEPSAQVRRVLENQESLYTTRDQHSIVSFLNSWLKVVISLLEMEQVVNQSMVRNLKMKTSLSSILTEVICLWLTLDPIQTVHSSS